ncbi:MAG: sigma-70 family RNA polymerase sigma factor [Solirubrobacterales bacterium]
MKEELCRRLLPFARSLALRYRDAPEQLDDLMQVASLGLVKALDGFDPARGVRFPAYAAPTILGELRRHFRDLVSDVHFPRGLQERVMAVSSAAGTLTEEQGRTPTMSAIATRLGLFEEEVAEALAADEARHTLSLDAPSDRTEADSPPLIESVEETESELEFDRVEAQLAVAEVPLDDRERTVLRLRFDEDLTQREIGHQIGVSQMQVSRILRRALRRLLDAVQGRDPEPSGGAGTDSELYPEAL